MLVVQLCESCHFNHMWPHHCTKEEGAGWVHKTSLASLLFIDVPVTNLELKRYDILE